MDLSSQTSGTAEQMCPVAHAPRLQQADRLLLAEPRRMVVQRTTSPDGNAALVLYYEDKEISFEEPHLFPFAESLAQQHRFSAGDTITWGNGYEWSVVRDLLVNLLDARILSMDDGTEAQMRPSRVRPSPLPTAKSKIARDWGDCAAITAELTGRAVDPAHLELIVPVFRVAHIALDADGRQVGEANVFPRALRMDAPTEWMTCPFPGTRYDSDRPMNTTALKAMRSHWDEMMAALKFIRARFLARFPEAAAGWTLAHVERLASLVLSVPTYQLVKANRSPDPLHPTLSSLFRVTDGLRMATHQMMFVPVGEAALPPHAPVSARQIFDYAERNYSFHSETGVCAGPSHMIVEFIETLLHGEDDGAYRYDARVATALDDVEAAFDYGLLGLRAHAALFSFWPAMARAYEAIAEIVSDATAAGHINFAPLRTRFDAHLETIRRVTLLGSEDRRQSREAAYADIFDACGHGLETAGASFAQRQADVGLVDEDSSWRGDLLAALVAGWGGSPFTQALATAICEFCDATRSIVTVSAACQGELNRQIGRRAAPRNFTAADIAVHAELLGSVPQRLPFLFDEIAAALGIVIDIDEHSVVISAAPKFSNSADNRVPR
ncbi:MAG: hypothetical protein ABL866_04295 [Devosia sp.]